MLGGYGLSLGQTFFGIIFKGGLRRLERTMQTESPPRRTFLTAQWRSLAVLNYPVEREVLEPLVPMGTVLDTYQGKAYLSLVGFLFQQARVFGLAVPLGLDFEEVNLRFYVRRFADGDWRRGVVFVKELVPRRSIAVVARAFYNENYVAVPMRHRLEKDANGSLATLEYGWQFNGRWNGLHVRTAGELRELAPGSLEEFITEHYWGYVRQKDGGCVEYQVKHPRWRVWQTAEASVDCDVGALYGAQFAPVLSPTPNSAFVAEGSAVTVFKGQRFC
jgi:hypothetical protein